MKQLLVGVSIAVCAASGFAEQMGEKPGDQAAAAARTQPPEPAAKKKFLSACWRNLRCYAPPEARNPGKAVDPKIG